MPQSSSLSERQAQIALQYLPMVGNQKAKELYRFFGSAERAMQASKAEWSAIPHIGNDVVEAIMAARGQALQRAEQEIRFIEQHHLQAYFYQDDAYPQRLAECPDCPMMLFGKGEMRLNEGKFVSVVGTRNPSDRGKQLCHDFVVDLAAKIPDVTIVSGLAYGIDVTAHRAALEAGVPTIIIPAHGLDRIYPYVHRSVAVEALKNGGILTEFPSGTEPVGSNFIARNRIIAGLADAVVVVESRSKGGSLATADMAFSYNRDLFAFPGRPSDVNSAGCNRLIKTDQAHLLETADDLIGMMRWTPKDANVEGYQTTLDMLFMELAPEEQALMDILHQYEDGCHVNTLVMETRQPYPAISALLFQMELHGLVRSLPGGVYKAAK